MAWLSGGWGQRIEITVSNTNIGSDVNTTETWDDGDSGLVATGTGFV